VAKFDQQIHEDIQSIIHEQSEPVYVNYASEGSEEYMDQFVGSHDDIVVVSVKETYVHIQDDLDSFDFPHSNDVHDLFIVKQMKYSLISEAEEQCVLLYQLEMKHN
jgi:hypothetical protein